MYIFVFDVSELGNRLSFNSNPLVFCASPGRQVPLFTRLACRRLQNTLQCFYTFLLWLATLQHLQLHAKWHLLSYKRRRILIHDVQDHRTILLQKKIGGTKLSGITFFFGESKNFAYDLGLWLSFQNPLEMILYLRSNKIVTGSARKPSGNLSTRYFPW